MIRIEKMLEGYIAHTTPPHGREEWHSPQPLTADKLIEELRRRGLHTTDISDAFYEADPHWLTSSG